MNPAHGVPEAVGEQVVADAGARRDERGADPEQPPIDHEFKAEQAEIGSRPTTSTEELTEDLRRLRRELASVAAGRGVQLAATATSPTKVAPMCGLERLRRNGTGSDQQRAGYGSGDLHDVVLDVVRRTLV